MYCIYKYMYVYLWLSYYDIMCLWMYTFIRIFFDFFY